MASPWPVFPEVGSTMVPPGRRCPFRSAASIIRRPMRSFTLPPGFSISSLASTVPGTSRATRPRRTRGVWPMASRKVSRTSTAPMVAPLRRSDQPVDGAEVAEVHGPVGRGLYGQYGPGMREEGPPASNPVPIRVQVEGMDLPGEIGAVQEVAVHLGAEAAGVAERGAGGGGERVDPYLRLDRLRAALGRPRACPGAPPPLVAARAHQVDLVVAGGPVLRLPQPTGLRVEGEPEGVPVTDREGSAVGEGVVRWPRAVLLHPEHLPRRVAHPLGPRRDAGVAGDRVQLAVGAEMQHAAVVEGGGGDRDQDLPLEPIGTLAEPDDLVPFGPPLGVVNEHPLLAGFPAGVEGDAQEALFADAGHAADLGPPGA